MAEGVGFEARRRVSRFFGCVRIYLRIRRLHSCSHRIKDGALRTNTNESEGRLSSIVIKKVCGNPTHTRHSFVGVAGAPLSQKKTKVPMEARSESFSGHAPISFSTHQPKQGNAAASLRGVGIRGLPGRNDSRAECLRDLHLGTSHPRASATWAANAGTLRPSRAKCACGVRPRF